MQYKKQENYYNVNNVSNSSSGMKERRITNTDSSLIIDENTVYEIDTDCYENAKRARLNQRNDWSKR